VKSVLAPDIQRNSLFAKMLDVGDNSTASKLLIQGSGSKKLNTLNPTMKTMLELLIRVQELRDCCERADRNPQLTQGEKNAVRFFKDLVRGCFPAVVLEQYDHLKKAEPQLLECPAIFGMAVLVSTYRDLTPAKRKKLLTHFATYSRTTPLDAGRNGKPRSPRNEGLYGRGVPLDCREADTQSRQRRQRHVGTATTRSTPSTASPPTNLWPKANENHE
jgi:hypothetical protein